VALLFVLLAPTVNANLATDQDAGVEKTHIVADLQAQHVDVVALQIADLQSFEVLQVHLAGTLSESWPAAPVTKTENGTELLLRPERSLALPSKPYTTSQVSYYLKV
jgi:hypothetical protein